MAQDNEWELSMENIKPLKSGRRIGELTLALKQDGNIHYKATIQEFEMQLRILEDEELINKWFDYICWIEQRCISSSHESLFLMKRCVKHFKNKPEFKNNGKYVRIWIKISESTDDPEDIFNYMFDQDIGTSLAIFYKAWAEHHELSGNTQKADEIFQLGINRNADPVDILKKRHSEFEWRMMKTPYEPGEKDDDDSYVKCRSVLNNLSSTKSGKVNSYRAKVKERTPARTNAPATNNRKGSSSSVFQIFDDENPGTSTLLPTAVGKWKKLPFCVEDKENAGKLEKMHAPKKSKSSVTVFSPNSFQIYQDTPDVETSDVFFPVSITSRKPLNSITSQVPTDMLQDLEKDPSDAKAIPMYAKSKVYMGANEVSLEELKAQLPKYKKH